VINGGIPQRAPMQRHLKKFRADVARQVPAGYRGVVVLDYEAWRPIWEWRNSERVRSLSLEHARQTEGPGATEADAARGFERAARSFLERTLRAGREVRPEAIWAYYDFPAYHPGGPSPEEAARELAWMAELVDVAMPNIYPSRRIVNEPTRAWADTSFPERREWLDEKIGFAARFDLPIAPITRIRYHGRNDRYAHEPIGLADAVLTYRETAARVRGWVLWDYIRDEGDARRFREAADEGLGPVFSGLRDRVRLVAPHDVLAPRSAPGSGSGAGGGRGG
jgi:hypothetical protein